jgi:serine/threonine protein kinase
MADATSQVHDPSISEAITASDVEARSYDEQCRQIYQKIYMELKRPDAHQFRFVTTGTGREVLRGDNFLPLFFQSLVAHGFKPKALTSDIFVSRIAARGLYDFLAILIFATCSIEAARAFTTKIVGGDEQRVALPATRQYLTTLFGNDVDADKFFTAQAPFCTLVIKKRGELTIEKPEGWRLPYLEEKLLGAGAFGKVYKVRIASGHFVDHEEGSTNNEPVLLARKDYIVRKDFPPRSEREIMDQILSAQEHNNILKAYGSLDIKPNTYSLFMPLAMCDLKEYMLGDRQTAPPGTTTEKAKFIQSAHGLAAGLNFLHSEMHTPNMDKLVCYHMDLKPDNILVFQERTHDDIRYVWKISDFGMARVKIRRHREHSESESDFDRWFIPRPKVQDPTPTGTRNWRMEGTYLAPESIVGSRSMKAESDVWSLGCVLSDVFAYLEGGREMALQYHHERSEHHDADGFDRFFLRATGWSSARLHPVVKKWHKDLIERATKRDMEEGAALKYILDYIKNSVLEIKQKQRATAGDVRDRLETTSQKYFNLGNAAEGLPAQLLVKRGKSRIRSR